MYRFKVGDLVKGNVHVPPFGFAVSAGYGIVIKTLDGGSHRKNQSVLVRWQNEAIGTWVVAPKLMMVAEAKTNEL